eukprot:7382751-Prymnesium_polylepis.1
MGRLAAGRVVMCAERLTGASRRRWRSNSTHAISEGSPTQRRNALEPRASGKALCETIVGDPIVSWCCDVVVQHAMLVARLGLRAEALQRAV